MEKTTSSTASAAVLHSAERLWVWHHFQSDFLHPSHSQGAASLYHLLCSPCLGPGCRSPL